MTKHLRGDGIGGCYPFKSACGLWVWSNFYHEKDRRRVTCRRRGCRKKPAPPLGGEAGDKNADR